MAGGHFQLDSRSPAMTSLNGIWPVECLGCVRGWCQSKCKQVSQSSAFTTLCNSHIPSRHHPPFPVGIYWNDSLWGSVEIGGKGVKYVLLEEIVDGGVGGDKGGRWQAKMEKITTTATKIFCSRMRVYTLQLLALFGIFCIFTYTKYFQTALCLFENPTRRCLVKLLLWKAYFLGDVYKTVLKFLYIHHKSTRRVTVITHILEKSGLLQLPVRQHTEQNTHVLRQRKHLVGWSQFLKLVLTQYKMKHKSSLTDPR